MNENVACVLPEVDNGQLALCLEYYCKRYQQQHVF